MMIFTNWQTFRWTWKGALMVWAILAILAAIPQIGIAVLNWQADECSVLVDGQQQVLHGSACNGDFPATGIQ